MKRLLVLIAIGMMAAAVGASAQIMGTLRANIVDEEGRPIPGAQIRLVGSGRTATVDSTTGGLIMAGMEPASYMADVVAPGHAPQRIRFEIGPGHVTDIGRVRVGTVQPLGTCSYQGMYGDAWSIRTIDGSGRESSAGESFTFHVDKSCE